MTATERRTCPGCGWRPLWRNDAGGAWECLGCGCVLIDQDEPEGQVENSKPAAAASVETSKPR